MLQVNKTTTKLVYINYDAMVWKNSFCVEKSFIKVGIQLRNPPRISIESRVNKYMERSETNL